MSVTYQRELLIPSIEFNLYFKVAEQVATKALVAALCFYDEAGEEVTGLEPFSFSSKLSRQYVYLRSARGTVGDWVKANATAPAPVKRVEIEIMRWSKHFHGEIADVVHGVWLGQRLGHEDLGNSANFVALGEVPNDK